MGDATGVVVGGREPAAYDCGESVATAADTADASRVVVDRVGRGAVARWVRQARPADRIVAVVETREAMCHALGAGATDVVVAAGSPPVERVRARLARADADADARGGSDAANESDATNAPDPRPTDQLAETSVAAAVSSATIRIDDRWRVTETDGEVESVLDTDPTGEQLWRALPTVDGTAAWRLRAARETGEPKRTLWTIPGTRLDAVCVPDGRELVVGLRSVPRAARARAERDRLARMLETVDDGIYTLDADFRIRSVNDAVTELTGYDRDRLVGAHASLLAPPETIEQAASVVQRLRAGDETVESLETELARADGSRVPVQTRFSTMEQPNGETIHVGVVRDVTEQRRYEQTLRALNRSAQSFLDATDERAVWEQLVETGRTVLSFDAVAAYQFDETATVLRPMAVCATDLDTDSGASGDSSASAESVEPVQPVESPESIVPEQSDESLESGQSDESTRPRADGSGATVRDATDEPRQPYDPAATTTADLAPLAADSTGWRQFVAGDRATQPGAGTPLGYVPAGRHALYVPVADHGLLVACVSDARVSETTDELVDLLTANGAAALDRLDRESQLTRRERELATRAEELERANRINEVVRDLNAALVDARTRSAVESAILDRLTDVDCVAAAWIGEHTADGMAVRAATGATEYVDRVLADETTTDEPARLAAREGEPVVVSNVAERLRDTTWCEHALAADFQSAAAVPIRTDNVDYGVLAVYATRRGTFDSPASDVLREFAGTIATAVDRAETKRTLAGGAVSVVDLRVTAPDRPLPRIAREVGESVTVRSATPLESGAQVCLAADRLPTEAIATVPGVASIDPVGEGTCAVRLTQPTLPTRIAVHGGVTTDATVTSDGVRATVEVPETAVGSFLDTLRAEFPDVQLTARRSTRSGRLPAAFHRQAAEKLTDRQLDVLETSYAMGYYEWPRDASGQQVADSLDIAQPTFANHLRTAHRKLFELFFDRDS